MAPSSTWRTRVGLWAPLLTIIGALVAPTLGGCSSSTPTGPSATPRPSNLAATAENARSLTTMGGAGSLSTPGAPVSLASLVSDTTVTLTWGAPAGSDAPISYVVEAGAGPGLANLAVFDTGSAATALSVPDVPAGSYYVRLRARGTAGTGPASNEIVVTVGNAPGDPPPVLSVTIVDLSGAYDPATSRLGSLNCTFRFPTDPNDRWCFGAFGAVIGTGGKASPSYDYKVAVNALVSAATSGIVTRIDADTSPLYPGEFEIETRTSLASSYLVIYDHVKYVQVGLGQAVAPGQILGTAGIHRSNPSVYGRVELQINQITQRTPLIQSVSLCPRPFGTPQFNAVNDAALAAHNLANPDYAAAAVCLAQTVGGG
ncbi:MAG: hypothetical protein ACT4QD_06010 [Acidobacteriota bacterium]